MTIYPNNSNVTNELSDKNGSNSQVIYFYNIKVTVILQCKCCLLA